MNLFLFHGRWVQTLSNSIPSTLSLTGLTTIKASIVSNRKSYSQLFYVLFSWLVDLNHYLVWLHHLVLEYPLAKSVLLWERWEYADELLNNENCFRFEESYSFLFPLPQRPWKTSGSLRLFLQSIWFSLKAKVKETCLRFNV